MGQDDYQAASLQIITLETLPEGVTDWCLSQQESLSEGELLQWVDEETGVAWFVRFEGFSGSGLEVDARAELAQQAIAAQLEEGLQSYTVSRNAFGMLLAAN